MFHSLMCVANGRKLNLFNLKSDVETKINENISFNNKAKTSLHL